jgi:hypothetical protein
VAAPEEPRCARWSSAPGLAPTEPASWRQRDRRWQFLIGAFALAASATMFVVTRDRDSAAATQAATQAAPATAPEPAGSTLRADPAPAVVEIATDQRRSAIPAPSPKVQRPRAITVSHAVSHAHAPHKPPVTPHRLVSLDPDGTIDPYP